MEKPVYQIRRASRTDLSVLQDIERAASILFPEGRLPESDDVMPMSELEQACDHQLVLVALLDKEIVGFAMSSVYDGYLYLAVMAVHPDHGRRGIGTRLVRAVMEQAANWGLSGVTLTTFRDLAWNAPFYEKLGFRVLNDVEQHPMLRATLAQEERLGMTDRVAMLYSNGTSH